MAIQKKMKCPITKLCKKLLKKDNKTIIASVTLSGVIGKDSKLESGINITNCAPLIKKAFETKKAKAVAININSPGGSPVQSELIYNYIRELSNEKKIPVYTFAQDLAASGGYWLLLSGDEIYAHNSSLIGSIGVIFSGFGFVELIKKIGVERRVYTEGKNKAILDPFMPEQEENIEILKQAQKGVFESFKELVSNRRKGKLKEKEENLFTGAFWSGKDAKKLGLIDDIADVRSKMKEKFGDKIEIKEVTSKKGFLKGLLSSRSTFGQEIASNLIYKTEEKLQFNKFGL